MNSHPPEKDSTSPQGSNQDKEDRVRQNIRQLRAASVGWNFVAAPLVGGVLGYGVDRLFSTYPWGMIIGGIFGFIAAFIELLRSAR